MPQYVDAMAIHIPIPVWPRLMESLLPERVNVVLSSSITQGQQALLAELVLPRPVVQEIFAS